MISAFCKFSDISSLDISRKNLALNGKEIFQKVTSLVGYGISEINKIGGLYAFSRELINGDDIFDFDPTKISVHTRDIGLAGIEVYDILRDKYNIQIEFGDIGNILAIVSVGDRILNIERLISALSEIKRRYSKDPAGMFVLRKRHFILIRNRFRLTLLSEKYVRNL